MSVGKVLAISGVKNSGKTTLIETLLPLLNARGLKVAVIKHDGHALSPEPADVDTGRAWAAGAYGTAVFDGEKFLAVKRQAVDEHALLHLFPEADLVLLEGFKGSRWPKIEVVRRGVSDTPVCEPFTLLAVVSDLPIEVPRVPTLDLNDVPAIADLIVTYVGREQHG